MIKLRARYKSDSMKEMMSSYQSSDVDERTKRVILSGDSSELDIYEAAIKDLQEQERRLNEIGREHLSKPVRFVYRLADKLLGVTSFDYRVKRQQRAVDQAKKALEYRLNKYEGMVEDTRDKLREKKKLKRGAMKLRSQYSAMEASLVEKEQELSERTASIRQNLAKSPEDHRAMDELDRAEEELEDYEADMSKVLEERSAATGCLVGYHHQVQGLEHNKAKLDLYMKALRQKYLANRLLETRLAGVAQNGLDPVGTMEVLRETTQVTQEAGHFAEAASSIQLEGLQAALNLPEESFSYSPRSDRRMRELKQKGRLFDNQLEDLADRILEEERRSR